MPQDTRGSLVASARRLLDSGGTEAVTLREVGRLSGLSRIAPHEHFADEESLLAAVAAKELERLGGIIDRAAGQAFTAREALRTVLHSYTAWAMDHPERFSLVFGAWSGPQEEPGAAARRTRASLAAVVRQCQAEGVVPDGNAERRTALLLAAAHGAVSLALTGHLGPDRGAGPEDVVDDLLELLGSAAGKR
ncbi:TetR/AcrR family transcriptional regulator [Nocardiopsis quinghaiensis]|uniref:TetR/AcrR family transcriptional regulator n=1 Tax=Nocardiopsis quinghaiensis TaxID=464995 RepID=UPI00123943A0|nr:TetR/AcrR family transcriptional regulator [Nocardiopsis quinghaiensis]